MRERERRAQLQQPHLVTGVDEVHCGDHAGEAGTDDANLELLLAPLPRSADRAPHQVLVQKGIVALLRPRSLADEARLRLLEHHRGRGAGRAGAERPHAQRTRRERCARHHDRAEQQQPQRSDWHDLPAPEGEVLLVCFRFREASPDELEPHLE